MNNEHNIDIRRLQDCVYYSLCKQLIFRLNQLKLKIYECSFISKIDQADESKRPVQTPSQYYRIMLNFQAMLLFSLYPFHDDDCNDCNTCIN